MTDCYTLSVEDFPFSAESPRSSAPREYCFRGPGMPHYANGVVTSEHDAQRVQTMLALAFEAGRKAKAKEICLALGVVK